MMSMSREHYLAQLVALRAAYRSVAQMRDAAESIPCPTEYGCGLSKGFAESALMIMEHIRGVQRCLRKICNVEYLPF